MSTAAAPYPPGADAPVGSGLSAADVRERTLAGLANGVPDTSSRSLWQIIRANVLTLFNGIVGGCFLLLFFLGQWQDALFGFAALSNAVIGVVQEYRAKRLLDRLAVVDAARVRVLRGGLVQEIAVADVVLGDITVLQAGDQVVADAVIIDDTGLEVDESLLPGESEAVDKDRGSRVLSGSAVTAGQGRARVVAVGTGSYASRLTAEAKRYSLVNSEIRNGIARVLRWISWALLPVVVIVTNGQMQAKGGRDVAFNTGTWVEALVGAVAGAIAMIPLGFVCGAISRPEGILWPLQQRCRRNPLPVSIARAESDCSGHPCVGQAPMDTAVIGKPEPGPVNAPAHSTPMRQSDPNHRFDVLRGWGTSSPGARGPASSL